MKPKGLPLITISTLRNIDDVILVDFCANLKVDLPTAQQIVAQRLNFTGNEKHYLVVDISNVRSVTAEAKNYLQSPDGGLKNILAAALIASNPVSSLIANIFAKTRKDFDAKFFHHKQDAFDWVCKQRQKHISNSIIHTNNAVL
ncbi:MAG: hypothetical protein WEB30_01950 [Cyclobacteriaceae bacterium]